MAPLKFRAWLPNENEMHSVESILFNDNDEVKTVKFGEAILWDEESGGYGWERDAADVILMQSTGLLNKNGVIIYEGDIVRGKETGVVEWFERDGAWGVNVGEGQWAYLFSCNLPDKHEVIGNVHEHPHLLPPQ